jgi:hypothetical protein
MLRFDGEVFLFGTAIRHLLDCKKIGDDLRLVSTGGPAAGEIIAIRGPYSD